jgi:uncharacterized membrane protein SpoIIM required for sporulation
MFVIDFWKNASTRTKRMITIAVFFVLAILITAIGTLTPLTSEEAAAINRDFNKTAGVLDNMPPLNQVSFILGNNFMLCLLAFIPLAGAFFEFYVMYSTGVTIVAITYGEMNPLLAFSSLFIFPFAWLEFLAYSIAISESFWLFWRIIHRKGKMEIRNACILISVSAVVLFVAAIIEVAMLAIIA